MAIRSVDPLVVVEVVGKAVDTVFYGSKLVTNGCEIKSSATVNCPAVQLPHRQFDDALFTLVDDGSRHSQPQRAQHARMDPLSFSTCGIVCLIKLWCRELRNGCLLLAIVWCAMTMWH